MGTTDMNNSISTIQHNRVRSTDRRPILDTRSLDDHFHSRDTLYMKTSSPANWINSTCTTTVATSRYNRSHGRCMIHTARDSSSRLSSTFSSDR